MKLTAFILLTFCLAAGAKGHSQTVTLSLKNVPVQMVFKEVIRQTNISILYNEEVMDKISLVTVQVKNATVTEVMEKCVAGQPITYTVEGNKIIIKKKPEPHVTLTGEGKTGSSFLEVKGRVMDELRNPVAGASIKVKGTTTGTTTNNDGLFSVTVPSQESVLMISGVGIEAQEVPVGNRTFVVILVKTKESELDQVQVMAYTNTTRRLNTSNTVTITAAEIAKHPVQNVLEVLKDRVPGMYVQQNTGLPGGSFDVQIRGTSSFGDNAPLYIIDGVAYPANSRLPIVKPGGNRDQFLGGNALNYINPDDIETINVLKDADATAIYGSRGAYGVVLITTKKAKAGVAKVNLNTYVGMTKRSSYPELLNTEQYLMLRREAFKNDGLTPGVNDKDINGTWPEDRYTDWQNDLIGKTAFATNTNLSYSGGSENTRFLVAANYGRQNSIQVGKGSNRNGGLRFDLGNTTRNNKFSFNLGGNYSSEVNDAVPIDFSGNFVTVFAPNAPPFILPDGSLNWETGSNPYSALNLTYKNVTNNLLTNGEIAYQPIKNLRIKISAGYNQLTGDEFRATPTTYYNPGVNSVSQTTSYTNHYNIRTITIEPNVSYKLQLDSRNTLTATTGATFQDQQNDITTVTGTNFATDALLLSPTNAITVSSSYNKTVNRYSGFFGVINYNFNNKYILNLNGRLDGSTKFGPDHRWGAFGSAGAAWIFTEEAWVKNHLPFINFGKVNGSYGITGGDGIQNYLFLQRFLAGTAYQGTTPLTPSSPQNATLHWEKNKKTAVGIVLEFFRSRLGIEANYFRTISTDLLVNQPLSSITGFTQYPVNTPAVIQNTGYEVTLHTRNIQSKNFSWSSGFNITVPRNKLVSFPGLASLLLNFNYEVGRSLNGIKVFNYAGVDPATGYFFFTTAAGVTGQNLLTLNQTTDKTAFVDLQPKYYGSLNNRFTFRSLAVDFTFTGRRRTGQNFLGQQQYTFGIINNNSSTAVLRRWQKPGDVTDVPKVSTVGLNNIFQQNNFRQSTGAYELISYARLQNFTVSYDFIKLLRSKLRISAISAFIKAENLLFISKYGDMDPENLSVTSTPPLKTYTAGFNVTF